MPPPHHSIMIHFIRRTANGAAQTDESLDDTLRIQKLGENNVRVTYSERSEDGCLVDTTLMTYQKLIHYLYRVFWMLSLDEDPFQSVQFIVPGYPTTLIRVDALRPQLVGVMDILTSTLWQWPTIGRPEPDDEMRREGHMVTPESTLPR
jgi:hypothetical protein